MQRLIGFCGAQILVSFVLAGVRFLERCGPSVRLRMRASRASGAGTASGHRRTRTEINAKEIELIVALRANDPAIGYNLWPKLETADESDTIAGLTPRSVICVTDPKNPVADEHERWCAAGDGPLCAAPVGPAAAPLCRCRATFVARLRPGQLPDRAARQLPDLSTTIPVEPSSTDGSRRQGALPWHEIAAR